MALQVLLVLLFLSFNINKGYSRSMCCRNDCGKYREDEYSCQCDSDCLSRGDCCDDYVKVCPEDAFGENVFFFELNDAETRFYPRIDRRKCNDCSMIWIHGFNTDRDRAIEGLQEIAYSYRLNGGNCNIYGLHWNTSLSSNLGVQQILEAFLSQIEFANEIGSGVYADFIEDLYAKCGKTKMSFVAHSLGSRVVLNILETIPYLNVPANVISNAIIANGAVDDESLEPNQEFEDAADNVDENVYIVHDITDQVLTTQYTPFLGDLAIGQVGPENPDLVADNVITLDFTDDFNGDHSAIFDPTKNVNFWQYFVPIIENSEKYESESKH